MSDAHQETVTRLLGELRAGSPDAFDGLLPLVYDELRALARRQRRRWHGDETLDSTALVHEVYFRLVDQSAPEWESRAHFLSVASRAMRQIRLDYAKRKHAAKRDGGRDHVPLQNVATTLLAHTTMTAEQSDLLVALDESLRRLERDEPRQSRIVECRFFGGMTIDETAEALGISPASVKRGWAMAQAWLYRDLAGVAAGAS
jgi:RNA polymerase sigma factor (TIGR02999 family)